MVASNAEVTRMASIDSVELEIARGGSYGDSALLIVNYTMHATLDDVQNDRAYQEHVQVYTEGRRVGLFGLEHPIAGAVYDGTYVFPDDSEVPRNYEKLVPLAALEQGIISPSQPDAIRARVTLTPLPAQTVTHDSNTVDISTPVVANA
jgi:hypothetical protein